MKNLLMVVMAASFAVAGSSAFAAAHGGAMKDGAAKDAEKMMANCKDKAMMDKMDDKMKGECKKMLEMKAPEVKK